MTEYDYSPDAVERFMEKQNSVARWVDRQAREAQSYSNPFVPDSGVSAPPIRNNSGGPGGATLPRSISTPPDPRHAQSRAYVNGHGHSQRTGQGHKSHTSSNSASTTIVQPQPRRYTSTGLGSTSQHSHSNSHSRSHSSAQTAVYNTRRPPPARSQTYTHALNMANASASATHLPTHGRTPTRSQTLPTQPHFTSAPGQTVVMHNGRQTYVVVPPQGTRVQVCSPQSSSPTYTAAPQNYVPAHYPFTQAVSPSRDSSSKKPPLLKRLFGLPGNNSSQSHGHSDVHVRRSGKALPAAITSADARRRTTSMHY